MNQVVHAHVAFELHIFFLQLEVPKELISQAVLEELRVQRRPSFVPMSKEGNATKLFDKETGITQCCLSNGIPVNYKVPIFSNDCCVHHFSI